MDMISIHDLKINTIIGEYAWEKQVRQTLILHLDFATDCKKIAKNDDLTQAVDYTAVVARIHHLADVQTYQLIETFAETVAAALQGEFALTWLKLTVFKPGALPYPARVGVTIERKHIKSKPNCTE